MIRRYDQAQRYATSDSENEPYRQKPCLEKQKTHLWANLCLRTADCLACDDSDPSTSALRARELAAVSKMLADNGYTAEAAPTTPERRAFVACVICAMMSWSEDLHYEYIAGAGCKLANREKIADLLDTERYKARWLDIPEEELDSSAVEFTYATDHGIETTKHLLLHKRRVSAEAQRGEEQVRVCPDCRRSLWKSSPTMANKSIVNDFWLGRMPPLFKYATLAHQLLLALGRGVTTKVFLSSRGVDAKLRQELESWRQKFLQCAMKGTAIVLWKRQG